MALVFASSAQWRRIVLPLLAAAGALAFSAPARADVCTTSSLNISFGNVSPVAGVDYVASGTMTVTCTFVILDGNIILLPNINGCINGGLAGDAANRALTSSGRRIPFNMYRTASYTAPDVWEHYSTNTAISSTWAGLLAIGTATQSYPVYAKIAASDLAGAAIDTETGTLYSSSTTGTLNYTSASIIVLNCHLSGNSVPFAINVTANIANDCRINTTPVAFGPRGVLNGAVRATGSVSVRCTAGNSYRIGLNGGTGSGLAANRKMKNAVTGEMISYRLSASLDGPIWGDGSGGTAMVTSSGNGATQQLTVFGMVPPQLSPTPGDYSDRVTATVYF